jgi:hypothetical protein
MNNDIYNQTYSAVVQAKLRRLRFDVTHKWSLVYIGNFIAPTEDEQYLGGFATKDEAVRACRLRHESPRPIERGLTKYSNYAIIAADFIKEALSEQSEVVDTWYVADVTKSIMHRCSCLNDAMLFCRVSAYDYRQSRGFVVHDDGWVEYSYITDARRVRYYIGTSETMKAHGFQEALTAYNASAILHEEPEEPVPSTPNATTASVAIQALTIICESCDVMCEATSDGSTMITARHLTVICPCCGTIFSTPQQAFNQMYNGPKCLPVNG